MRVHGLADSAGRVGLNGHACWGYDGPGDFLDAAGPFLREGAQLNQRMLFVGSEEIERVVREAAPTKAMLERRSLAVMPFDVAYPGGRRMANDSQLALYARATEQALADGFSGLRVLAEVTTLADEPGAWADQACWESLADRYMAQKPLSALCCFDRSVLPDQAIGAIASMHPVADRRLESIVPFRIFALADGLALAGELDTFAVDRLAERLDLAVNGSAELTLDLGDLDFIDQNGLIALRMSIERHRRRGVELRLKRKPAAFHRLVELVGFDETS